MSEENQAQSGENIQTDNQEEIVVTKSAEELLKRLKEVSQEAKQQRQKAAELKRQLEESEKKKLQDNGQYKELAEVWQRKAQEAETLSGKLKSAFAFKTVHDAIAMEAVKLGAKNVDHVVSLIPLDQIPVDDNFNVDRKSVSIMLEDFKKSNDYMFAGKPGPKIIDSTPSAPKQAEAVSIDKLDSKQIEALLKEKFKKG